MATREVRDYRRGIGVYKTRRQVEQALYRLRDRGIDLEQVSVIAPDADPATKDSEVEVYRRSEGNHADTGAAAGAAAGGALGLITGILVGLGAAAIPGIGPILLAGAEATALATTLAGTGIGAASGGLIGALIGLGIPEDRAKVYNHRLANGQYIVLATGTPRNVDRIGEILRDFGIEEWRVYDAREVEITPNDGRVSAAIREWEAKPQVVYQQELPEVVEREETAVITPWTETTVRPEEREAQRRREIIEKEVVVMPPVETEYPVESGPPVESRREAEPKRHLQTVTPVGPQTKGEPVPQPSPKAIGRNERATVTRRVESEVPTQERAKITERKEKIIITRRPVDSQRPVESEHLRADLKKGDRENIEGKKLSEHPEVILVDRRDEEYKNP